MTRAAHFRVAGRFGATAGALVATVTVERTANSSAGPEALLTVRPLHSRKTYSAPLSLVAAIIVQREIERELREERATAAAARKRRR